MSMMMSPNLVNSLHFENWNPNQVAEWLRGLDDVILPYSHMFLNHGIDGKKLLMLTSYDLEKINITKLGHQELILEAVDLLRALRYGYETENLQHLALKLGCKARSLKNEIQANTSENDRNQGNVPDARHGGSNRLSVGVLSAIADISTTLRSVVSWLDRPPFESIYAMQLLRSTIVKHGIELVSAYQKSSKNPNIEEDIVRQCDVLTDVCDDLVKDRDSLVCQPASLELANIRKKPGEELGMHIQSSYSGIHVIGGVKAMSPAYLCGKIEKGDEVIQVNHRTVVGWQLTKLVNSLKEKPKEVILVLKKRPHHINPFGHMPKKKAISSTTHTVSILPKPAHRSTRRAREGEAKKTRPSLQELVSNVCVDDIDSPREERTSDEKEDGNDTDNDVFRSGSESPQYIKPVTGNQKPRRATVSGGSPTLSRPVLVIEDIDTPSRPKSFTIASTEAQQVEFKDVGIPGEESNLLRLGDSSKAPSAQQKRQDFKTTKPAHHSLEYVVKKPIPIEAPPALKVTTAGVPEHVPDIDPGLEEDLAPQSANLLEVPSRFKTFSAQEDEDESKYLGEEKDQDPDPSESSTDTEVKVHPDSSDNITTSDVQVITDSASQRSSKASLAETEAEVQKALQIVKAMTLESEDLEEVNDAMSVSANVDNKNSALDSNGNSVVGGDSTAFSSMDNERKRPIPAERTSLTKARQANSPLTFRRGHADADSPKRSNPMCASVVALPAQSSNDPQLMTIRKRGSSVPFEDEELKDSGKTESKEMEEDENFQIIIVGGVPQKIPIQSESPRLRHPNKDHKKRNNVSRRISCKDLGDGECQGWLYKKKTKADGLLRKNWRRRWVVLKHNKLYYFKEKQDMQAEGVIYLPAFQVSPVAHMKDDKFAFNVHNTGASFLFASTNQADMAKWMNKMQLSTLPQDSVHTGAKGDGKNSALEDFSESEEEGLDTKSLSSLSSGGSQESIRLAHAGDTMKKQGTPHTSTTDLSHSESTEELRVMYRNIEKTDLTIDGVDKRRKRRTTLGALDDVVEADNSEEVARLKKLHSLQRTLKAKEKELEDLEKLLSQKPSASLLKQYEEISLNQPPSRDESSDSEQETFGQ